jgi:hypothetical protein
MAKPRRAKVVKHRVVLQGMGLSKSNSPNTLSLLGQSFENWKDWPSKLSVLGLLLFDNGKNLI